MKKFLLILLMIMTITCSSMSAYSYDNDNNMEFKTIKVGMPSIINIVKGDSFQIAIRTNNLYNEVKYEIEDSTLKIWLEDIYNDLYDIDSKNIKIRITIPNEEDIVIKTLNRNLLVAPNMEKKLISYEYKN